jgi:hypothetical protein
VDVDVDDTKWGQAKLGKNFIQKVEIIQNHGTKKETTIMEFFALAFLSLSPYMCVHDATYKPI